MSKTHDPDFERLCDEARARIRECTVDEIKARIDDGDEFFLFDTREDREWEKGRIAGAEHLGKGVIERDIHKRVPDKDADIVLYCGGGYRSALAADNLQKMGYRTVASMGGGFREWCARGYPSES